MIAWLMPRWRLVVVSLLVLALIVSLGVWVGFRLTEAMPAAVSCSTLEAATSSEAGVLARTCGTDVEVVSERSPWQTSWATPERAITAGQRGAIQAHHLIERRFARQMGGNTDDWATIVVTRSEHQVFTNAWRRAIPYGAGTRTASRAQIEGTARQIYSDYPEILRALGLG